MKALIAIIIIILALAVIVYLLQSGVGFDSASGIYNTLAEYAKANPPVP